MARQSESDAIRRLRIAARSELDLRELIAEKDRRINELKAVKGIINAGEIGGMKMIINNNDNKYNSDNNNNNNNVLALRLLLTQAESEINYLKKQIARQSSEAQSIFIPYKSKN